MFGVDNEALPQHIMHNITPFVSSCLFPFKPSRLTNVCATSSSGSPCMFSSSNLLFFFDDQFCFDGDFL